MRAKIPKMICGIIATISIVVVGFFSLSAFWFWTCLEITAGGLVAGGCWGEWYLFKNPPDEGDESQKLLHRRKELQCIIAVAIGVTVEFAALSHAIPEAIRLEKDVEEIGTTNAQLVAENLVSRSNVAALELRVMEISNNVVKNDPRNQPILSFEATAIFEVRTNGQNINGLEHKDLNEDFAFFEPKVFINPNIAHRWGSGLMFGKRGQVGYGANLHEFSTVAGIGDIFLSGSKYKSNVTEFVVLYSNSKNNFFENHENLSFDDLDEAYFDLPPNQYLNEPFEVISGIVKISVNSSVTKWFKINPQIDRSGIIAESTTNSLMGYEFSRVWENVFPTNSVW
jgi:hypothetical protein